MRNKSIYELGILAQKGDEMAMLEIIDRKKPLLKANWRNKKLQILKFRGEFFEVKGCLYSEGQILRKHYIKRQVGQALICLLPYLNGKEQKRCF